MLLERLGKDDPPRTFADLEASLGLRFDDAQSVDRYGGTFTWKRVPADALGLTAFLRGRPTGQNLSTGPIGVGRLSSEDLVTGLHVGP